MSSNTSLSSDWLTILECDHETGALETNSDDSWENMGSPIGPNLQVVLEKGHLLNVLGLPGGSPSLSEFVEMWETKLSKAEGTEKSDKSPMDAPAPGPQKRRMLSILFSWCLPSKKGKNPIDEDVLTVSSLTEVAVSESIDIKDHIADLTDFEDDESDGLADDE